MYKNSMYDDQPSVLGALTSSRFIPLSFISPDADILKVIIVKLQKRVEAGVATLLIKVKDHRGDPLNEETDIRAELGRQNICMFY